MIALLCRPCLTVGIIAIQLENLNAIRVIGSRGGRAQVVTLNCQRQVGCGYPNGEQSQNSNQNSLTCTELWHWLANHGVSRSEIDGELTKFYFICIAEKFYIK